MVRAVPHLFKTDRSEPDNCMNPASASELVSCAFKSSMLESVCWLRQFLRQN